MPASQTTFGRHPAEDDPLAGLGFGDSDKQLDVRYDFEFFECALDGLLAELDVDEVALSGHDLGGPIALHWALAHPGRVTNWRC